MGLYAPATARASRVVLLHRHTTAGLRYPRLYERLLRPWYMRKAMQLPAPVGGVPTAVLPSAGAPMT